MHSFINLSCRDRLPFNSLYKTSLFEISHGFVLYIYKIRWKTFATIALPPSFYNSTNARDVASLSLLLLQKDFSALAEFFLFRLSPRQFIVYHVTVYDSGVIFLFYDTR